MVKKRWLAADGGKARLARWRIPVYPTCKKLLSSHEAHDEAHDGHHRENEEKNFRDLYCTGSDSAKSEHRSNQGDHQEDDGIVEHVGFFALSVVIGVPSETPAARLRKTTFFSHRLRRCSPVSACVRPL
jgi:hypothetical protein